MSSNIKAIKVVVEITLDNMVDADVLDVEYNGDPMLVLKEILQTENFIDMVGRDDEFTLLKAEVVDGGS